jgi:hypothetical protein
MDTLTLAIAIVLMMLFLQFNQNWLVFGVLIISVLSSRSFSTTIVIILTAIVIYLTRDVTKELWPLLMVGLVTIALLLSLRKPEKPEYYAPDMGLGGLFGQEGMG